MVAETISKVLYRSYGVESGQHLKANEYPQEIWHISPAAASEPSIVFRR
jgi:hypothetical protein